jgi:GTP cyclohydrolase I
MKDFLPDVASHAPPAFAAPLEWVGMRGVELPLVLGDTTRAHPVQAQLDLLVDLPRAEVKGIHMSRLYLLAAELADEDIVRPGHVASLLAEMIRSHADCGTSKARVDIECRLLLRQPALATPGLAGWKAYPVRIEAVGDGATTTMTVRVSVAYSSTCPCSAALSRQLISRAFSAEFGDRLVDASAVAAWLGEHATLATPHSQRSIADIRLQLNASEGFAWKEWIRRVEAALGTPVQTAVKRADEQAFARLNGSNLMYVEDAARRIQAAFADAFPDIEVAVRHLESLHAHDAFAVAGPSAGRLREARGAGAPRSIRASGDDPVVGMAPAS